MLFHECVLSSRVAVEKHFRRSCLLRQFRLDRLCTEGLEHPVDNRLVCGLFRGENGIDQKMISATADPWHATVLRICMVRRALAG